MRHHVYFSPGMFGFGKLGSYTYFAHVERELTARFAAAGHELIAHVIEDLPTASIRRRSTRLAEVVQRTATGADPIHLLGHSTGGLDARLVASPSTTSIPAGVLGWLPRLRTITTMNTPHYGTPLASFFATSKGQRVLAVLSMLTVAGLTLGATPLRAMSVVLGFLQRGDLAIPFKLFMLDRAVESVVGMVDDAGSPEVRSFLAAIEEDQGSMLQLSPESMDLVVAGFEDRRGVRYQATASMSPAPTPWRWVQTVGHPVRALSLAIFYALHRITANIGERYPCHAHDGATASIRAEYEAQVTEAFGRVPAVAD
ncbi:MAG TPA: hypothetical protein VFQ65_16000, partial [Kofleriaceae bacterium]|nr:hypothetical protein [Kofleriaceae bacterium]